MKHGHAVGYKRSPTHGVWHGMLQRCLNSNSQYFHHYGGRGVTVCERWLKFENFLSDMGEKPANLSLDRIDNDAGYFPGNCRWATRAEQTRNTRRTYLITINGETKCLKDWAIERNLKYTTLTARIQRGMTPIDALLLGGDKKIRVGKPRGPYKKRQSLQFHSINTKK